MKKVTILIATLAFALMLAACGNGGATTGEGGGGGGAAAGGDGGGGAAADVGGAAAGGDHDTIFEPQTLRFWNGMTMAPENVQWHDTEIGGMIRDITGITLQTEFMVGDVEERAALVVASGDFPDIAFAWHAFDIFRDAGAIIQLNDLYEEHAPTIQSRWGNYVNRLKEPGTGILWGMAALGFGNPPLDYPFSGMFMRASAVEFHGWREFSDPDDFFQAIREYVAANPYNDQGLSNIGFSGSAESWRFVFAMMGGDKMNGIHNTGGYFYDPDNNWEPTPLDVSEVRYNWLLRLWELNQEGLLDPEFLSQDHDGYVSKIASGRVVAFYDEFWQVENAFELLRQEDRQRDMFIPMRVVYPHVRQDAYLGITAMAVRPDLVIFRDAVDPVTIMRYLDFLATDEMLDLRHWGVEGMHYQRNAQGRRYLTPEQYVERAQPGFADATGIMHVVQGAFPGPIRAAEERPDGSGVWNPHFDPVRAQFIYSPGELYNLERMGWNTFMDALDPLWESPYGFGWDIALPPDDYFLLDLDHDISTAVDTHVFYQRMIMANSRSEFDGIWDEMISIFDAFDRQPLLDFRANEVRRRVAEWNQCELETCATSKVILLVVFLYTRKLLAISLATDRCGVAAF